MIRIISKERTRHGLEYNQTYPDRDTLEQLYPARNILQQVIKAWLESGVTEGGKNTASFHSREWSHEKQQLVEDLTYFKSA